MKVASPMIPTSLSMYSLNDFVSEGSLESAQVIDQEADKLTIAAADLNGVTIEKCRLGGAQLPRLSARDALLSKSDFSGSIMTQASFNRVILSDCRMSGLDFSNAQLHDVVFKGCKLDMVNFRFADLRRVKFVDCQLVEADFLSGVLHDVTFESCQLEATVFEKATCKSVDLRTSELINIVGWPSLKGATIDGAQLSMVAPSLAYALGLTVNNG
ncbi:MAG: pentapeptide repeat-containing protein [Candidatus Saccharimonadales bacterium]